MGQFIYLWLKIFQNAYEAIFQYFRIRENKTVFQNQGKYKLE